MRVSSPISPSAPSFQRYGSGMQSRAARREWTRCSRKATQLIRAIKPLRDRGMVAEAADVLQRMMDERGPTGTDKPTDRLTNALDTEVRFGGKGKCNHNLLSAGR